jgi:hypothetical protein
MLITGKNIETARLLAIRIGVKLEYEGVRFKGRSRTAIAKEILNLPKSTPREVVFNGLTELINGRLTNV